MLVTKIFAFKGEHYLPMCLVVEEQRVFVYNPKSCPIGFITFFE